MAPGCVPRGLREQAQIEQGFDAPAQHPTLPPDETDQEHRSRRQHPPQPPQATGFGVHQRQHHREHPAAEQSHADHVEVSGPARAAAAGQQPGREHQRDHPDRHVDQEDPPPAPVVTGDGQDRPAGDRADGGGDAHRGAEEAERVAALGPPEQLLDQGRVLRRQCPGGQALHQPGHDHQLDAGRRPDQGAAEHERRQRGQEDPPPAEGVAEPTGRDQGQPEGQRVAGDDPLHRGRRRCPARAGSTAARPPRCSRRAGS